MLGADDRFAETVQFRIHKRLARALHILDEVHPIGQRAAQEMRRTLRRRGDGIIPAPGVIAAQCAARRERRVLKLRIGLELCDEVVQLRRRTLPLPIVWLVVHLDRLDRGGGPTGPAIDVLLSRLDRSQPVRVIVRRAEISRHQRERLVAAQRCQRQLIVDEALGGRTQRVGTVAVIGQRVHRVEREPEDINIVRADVGDTLSHVVVVRPGGIDTPLGHRLGDALGIDTERHGVLRVQR